MCFSQKLKFFRWNGSWKKWHMDSFWCHQSWRCCQARCKNCNHEMVNNAERMKSHFNACSKKTRDCSAWEGDSAAKQPRLIQSTLEGSSTGHTKQQEFDAAITKFVVGTNSPFVMVGNANLRRLVDILRPGTKTPSRQTLAGPLFDKVFAEEKLKFEKVVKDQVCTMMIDGWSTKVMEPVLGVAISVLGQTFLFDTLDTSGHPHTTDYAVEIFKEELIKIEAEWGVTVSSIVTDNTNNMATFRRLVKNPSELMHSYGCQSHHMKLLAKEFSAKVKNPFDRILHVKHLRLHHAESALLRQNNVPRPPLPTETRWNSVSDTLVFRRTLVEFGGCSEYNNGA